MILCLLRSCFEPIYLYIISYLFRIISISFYLHVNFGPSQEIILILMQLNWVVKNRSQIIFTLCFLPFVKDLFFWLACFHKMCKKYLVNFTQFGWYSFILRKSTCEFYFKNDLSDRLLLKSSIVILHIVFPSKTFIITNSWEK